MTKPGLSPRLHVGPIHSPVAGRTDHLPMHVPSGSYVLPADIVSAMGEGNTMHGFKVAQRVFGGQPYSQSKTPYGGGVPGRAMGGPVQRDTGVPIVAAGGEYVIHPDHVVRLGNGNMDAGHKLLDGFVIQYRNRTIKTLKNLAPPKKD